MNTDKERPERVAPETKVPVLFRENLCPSVFICGLPSSQSLQIFSLCDVAGARQAAKILAHGLGFGPIPLEEIALATTELATNLVKHALGGRLILTPLTADAAPGLQTESLDHGPGIRDVELAMEDRFSTAGSRGTGLGAVNRLMDELEIISQPGRVTAIICRKWVRQYAPSLRPCPLACGIATRPRPPGPENGDAFVHKQWAESVLVGIIDG